ncbi:MAG: FCD domain-containing protein [Pseudomonadota bacterium]
MVAITLAGLRDFLRDTGLEPGDRLPPERALSNALGISRAELRKALTIMEANGDIERQVGRGTYLAEASGKNQSTDMAALVARTSPHEAMMARLALEPQLAGMAAIHAAPHQLARVRSLASEMRSSGTWEAYEDLDARFHETIAKAARNALLEELHRIVNAVRVSVVWARLDVPRGGPPASYHSFGEHDAIVAALERRDRAAAQDAMRAHLKSVSATLTREDAL